MCRRLEQFKPIQSHERSDEALSSFPFDDDEQKMNFSTLHYFFMNQGHMDGRLVRDGFGDDYVWYDKDLILTWTKIN